MPIFPLRKQSHLWHHVKTHGGSYQLMSFQTFIRVEYKDGFIEYCNEHLPLQSYPVDDIPYVFWHRFIIWWHPKLTNDSRAFISEGFDFYNRGHESEDLVFIYDMPSEKICYIWRKINF